MQTENLNSQISIQFKTVGYFVCDHSKVESFKIYYFRCQFSMQPAYFDLLIYAYGDQGRIETMAGWDESCKTCFLEQRIAAGLIIHCHITAFYFID